MLKGFLELTGCKVIASSKMRISKELAGKHYASLEGRSFYPWLMDYITMHESVAYIMETGRPVAEIRNVLGSTMVEKAAGDSLRGMYGLANGMNGLHLSESEEVAKEEVDLWLSDGALKEGSIGFDTDAYISKYIRAPDNTRAIHTMLGDSEEKRKVVNTERNDALYSMLNEEAVGVDRDAVDKLYKMLVASLRMP